MGARTAAPITSATKFIEIITVSTAASSAALNTHIIKIVQTEFVKIPKTPASEQGKISFKNSLFELEKILFAKK